MTLSDLEDTLRQCSPREIMELLDVDDDVDKLVDALADYIEEYQDDIKESMVCNGLITEGEL